jgi:DNA-binding NarL/FixJ family response regulator
MPNSPRKIQEVSKRRKVFLVDDHPVLRNGLTELINRSDDLLVCGEASTAEDGLRKISELKPDLAIVDLSLDGASGLELVKNLKIRLPETPVLVLSIHDESFYAERCLRAGARGYIMKQEAIEEVKSAIRQILGGKIYLSPRMSERLLEAVARGEAARSGSPLDRLSDRELEVFEMIGRGRATAEIAKKLHLSVKTIETYQAKLKEKLNLKDAAELMRHALRWVEDRET